MPIYFLFLHKNICCGTHLKRLIDALLMCTQMFLLRNKKNIMWIPPSLPLPSYLELCFSPQYIQWQFIRIASPQQGNSNEYLQVSFHAKTLKFRALDKVKLKNIIIFLMSTLHAAQFIIIQKTIQNGCQFVQWVNMVIILLKNRVYTHLLPTKV